MSATGAKSPALRAIFGGNFGSCGTEGVHFLLTDAEEATELSDGSYDAQEGGTDGYIPLMRGGWARALHVTQEFGTVPGLLVARALAIESAEWRHRPPDERGFGARTARDAFYVRRATWQRGIRHRGMAVAEQALGALATEAGRDLLLPL